VHSQRAQDKELLRINKTANNQRIVQGKPTKHIVSEKQREITQRAKDLLDKH
jgi:hypothetical protein